MAHWVVKKRKEYISGTDEYGYPLHTKNKEKAWKFHDFNIAISFVNLGVGYCAIKEY